MINSNVMSKYSGIVIGVVAIFFGIKGLIAWRGDLLTVIKGSLPLFLILGAAIAVIAGISEIKDEISSKRKEKT